MCHYRVLLFFIVNLQICQGKGKPTSFDYIFYANDTHVSYVSVDGGESTVFVLASKAQLGFDKIKHTLWYSNGDAMFNRKLDGSYPSLTFRGFSFGRFAVNSVNETIYYINRFNGTIESMTYTGTQLSTISINLINAFTDIQVDPYNQLLVLTGGPLNNGIVLYDLAGINKPVIYVGEIKFSTRLTIDESNRMVYWICFTEDIFTYYVCKMPYYVFTITKILGPLTGNLGDIDITEGVNFYYISDSSASNIKKYNKSSNTLVSTIAVNSETKTIIVVKVNRSFTEWSEWSDWSPCSKTCGAGMKERSRIPPKFGCANCTGLDEETSECSNSLACPVNRSFTEWSEWSDWSPCSKTCGAGMKERSRIPPKFGCANCTGLDEETSECSNSLACPGSCPHLKDGSAEGRGVFSWPETKVGSRTTVACPHNHTVSATRKCQYKDNKIVWGPVDDKFCPFLHKKSQRIFDLSEENVSSSNAVEVGEQIKNLTYYGEKLIPEDVANVASVLEKIVAVKEKADEVADNVFSTIDNVLEASLDVVQTGQRRTNASRSIVHSLNTLLEALNITKEGSFRRTLNNFAVDLTVVSPRSFTGVTFYGIATSSALTNNSIVKEQSNNKTLSVAKATAIHIPQTLFNEATSVNFSQTQTVVIVLYKETKFFTVFSSEPKNFSQNLNSYVIAGSIKARTISNLKSPIVLTYPSLKRGDKQSASCVFWNFIHESWSGEGCSFQDLLADGRVVCHCNHLTNFAMLMDIFPDDKTGHEEILSLISYIGCAMSLLGLVLTIITILLFKDLRNKTPNQILLNFCIALCLTLVVFLAAAERSNTSSMARCRAAAVALHYFVLVAFMWMAIEAFNMYLLFVKVIPSHFSKFIQKCCLVAWGSPAIIVSITVGVAHGYYGDTKYCRVHGPAFFISFLTPVLLILVGNSIAFVLIFRSLLSSESKILSNRKVSGYQQARRGAAILALLGLTWTFGVFAINDAKVVFQYLFCIFNSLQGFLVFVFFCVLPSTTRNKCKNFLPKKKSKRSTEQNTNVESGIKLNVISKQTETLQLVSA